MPFNMNESIANMEAALADVLRAVGPASTPDRLERILKLILLKNILFGIIKDDCPPFPDEDCLCSIRGTRGTGQGTNPTSTITINEGTPVTGGETTWNIRICDPCDRPNPQVILNFQVPGTPTQNFNFNDVASEIVECDPVAGTATIEGVTRRGNDFYTYTLEITEGGEVMTFTANALSPTTEVQTFEATVTAAPNDTLVEIEPCNGNG